MARCLTDPALTGWWVGCADRGPDSLGRARRRGCSPRPTHARTLRTSRQSGCWKRDRFDREPVARQRLQPTPTLTGRRPDGAETSLDRADGPHSESPLVVEYPGGEEVPAVAWPMLLRAHRSPRPRERPVPLVGPLDRARGAVRHRVHDHDPRRLARRRRPRPRCQRNLAHVDGPRPFLALALAMPLFGKIGDVRGHRRVYHRPRRLHRRYVPDRPGLERFVLIIAIRTLGAIPGAATGPASMALIMRAFPEEDRVKAMGWWSLVGVGAPVPGSSPGPARRRHRLARDLPAADPGRAVALLLAIPILHETPGWARVDRLRRRRHLAAATVGALLGSASAARSVGPNRWCWGCSRLLQ